MTETEIRQKVVATAKKYVGCKESDGSHRRFVDAYNAFRPLPRNHRMTYTAAWCATFVSAVAIECGLTDIMPVECGCGYMIALYKKLGRWQSVIEGNKDDAVAYRTVTVNGRYIRGFGLPDYGSKATADIPQKPASGGSGSAKKKCPYAEPGRNLRYGAKGNGVKWVQWHLNYSDSGEKLSVDGAFGVLTKAVVLRFQKKCKLVQDGIVGSKTRAALRKAVM